MRMPGNHSNRNIVVDTTGIDKKSTLWRLLKIVLQNYKFSFLAVAVCIVVTACTTLASTLFTRTLIDDFITPMIGQARFLYILVQMPRTYPLQPYRLAC